ncbi:MAG: hypothetical protein AAGF95_32515 [Chloroflexota bacterium]
MPDKEDIEHQRELLAIHRRTLAQYLKQRAALSEAYTPPGVTYGIEEARKNIRRIKQNLRNWGETVEDHPDDEEYEEEDGDATQTKPNSANTSKNSAVSNAQPENTVPPTQTEPTIGIVTALPKEYSAMYTLLENPRDYQVTDRNTIWEYTYGEIPALNGGQHQIVLSSIGMMGNNSAAIEVMRLSDHFKSLEKVVLVGIAGGIPNPDKPNDHVRLGDIVVSDQYGAIQFDAIKQTTKGVEYRPFPRPPSFELFKVAQRLELKERTQKQYPWMPFITYGMKQCEVIRPDSDTDKLADSQNPNVFIDHPPDPKRRSSEPRIFLGPIASSNILLKDATKRDELRDRFNVKAVEMESSGIADATWQLNIDFFVVRGICDYCDANKNDDWQEYAAVVAAAYTRALLEAVPAVKVVAKTISSPDSPQQSESSIRLEIVVKLGNLLVFSGIAKVSARRALCSRIGGDPSKLGFINGQSDEDFATELVHSLYTAGCYSELVALCNEITPVLSPGKREELIAIQTKLEKLISQQEESKPTPSSKLTPSPDHQSIIELVNEACVSIQRACEVLEQPYLIPKDCREVIRLLDKIKQVANNLWTELNNKNYLSEAFEKLYSKVIFDRHRVHEHVYSLVVQLNQFNTECRVVTPQTQKKHQQLQQECGELRDILFGWQASTSQIVFEQSQVIFVDQPTVQSEAPIKWTQLDDDSFDTLIELLLKCRKVKNQHSRDQVVDRLGDIADKIERQNSPRDHIWTIVSVCRDYENGLDKLINSVKFFEGESTPMKNVLEFLRQFQK